MPTPEVWKVPRESGPEWVGPLSVTLVGTMTDIKFAVLPAGTRPTVFSGPDVDPEGSSGLGVLVEPVPNRVNLGIWARVVITGPNGEETIILEPASVGWIIRT